MKFLFFPLNHFLPINVYLLLSEIYTKFYIQYVTQKCLAIFFIFNTWITKFIWLNRRIKDSHMCIANVIFDSMSP